MPSRLCIALVIDLVCFFLKHGKIVLEKIVKELKLVKVVVTSRYWQSW